MVAVKNLWVLWKNFSTNFSISSVINNNQTSAANGSRNDDSRKRVRYNRLNTHHSTNTNIWPAKRDNSETSFQSNLETATIKYDSSSSGISSAPSLSNSSSYDSNGNQNSWKCTLQDSDTEYEEDNSQYNKNHRITMTSTEDSSDFDDEDEGLTCDVCDRSFPTLKRLSDHQQKKRHFGCLQCDSIFPSRQALDHHREQMDHYDFVSDYNSDTTSFESDEDGLEDEEERERLL